jgi:hypothetical protein
MNEIRNKVSSQSSSSEDDEDDNGEEPLLPHPTPPAPQLSDQEAFVPRQDVSFLQSTDDATNKMTVDFGTCLDIFSDSDTAWEGTIGVAACLSNEISWFRQTMQSQAATQTAIPAVAIQVLVLVILLRCASGWGRHTEHTKLHGDYKKSV